MANLILPISSSSTSVFIFVLANIISVNCVLLNSTNFFIKSEKFIKNVIQENFDQKCDLFFIQSSDKNKVSNDHEESFISNCFLENIERPSYCLNSWTNLTLNPFTVLPKHSEICNLIFFQFFQKFEPIHMSENLFQLLTPLYGEITRKDSDHYFILTNKHLIYTLLHLTFFIKIKYKLYITHNIHENDLIFTTSGWFFHKLHEKFEYKLKYSTRISDLFPNFQENFNLGEITLTCPTRLLFQIEIIQVNGNGNDERKMWDLKRGLQKFVIQELAKRFNFTYKVMPSTGGGGTGTKLPNGSWIGAISDILSNRAQVALATGHIFERFRYFDTTNNFLKAYVIFTTRLSRPIYSYKAIFWPFTERIWILVILSTSIFICAFLLNNKFSSGEWQLWKTCEFATSSIFEQGLRLTKKKFGRILCLFWLFFILVLSTGYKTKLFEFLVFPPILNCPTTFEELANSPGYKWGLENGLIGSAAQTEIDTSPNPIFQKIQKFMSFERNTFNCYSKSVRTDFACIAFEDHTKYIVARNFSSKRRLPFTTSKERIFSVYWYGMAVEKRAIFRNEFNTVIKPLVSGGITDKMINLDFEQIRKNKMAWEKKVLNQRKLNQNHSNSSKIAEQRLNYDLVGDEDNGKVSLKMLQGVFVVFLLLNSFAWIFFIIEFILFKILNKFLTKHFNHIKFKSGNCILKKIAGKCDTLQLQ